MVRASVVAEKTGMASVSLVSTEFLKQARAVAQGLGIPELAIAEYPGVPMVDGIDEVREKVEKVLVQQIINGLSATAEATVKLAEPGPRNIVFKGTLEEVHEFFYRNLWTEGLPIIPPTTEKVEQFLKFTDRFPDEVIGICPPENREATVWNIAVNGVMAGCRPEYMPILIAVVEAILEPEFSLEDAGATPGWEPLILLNGPIIKELDFNYGSGVMRVGRQANTSIGRFLRLYMRNVAGFRIPPGTTDKATIGCTFNVALAENEEAVAEIGWKPFSVDRGFNHGENVVTVQSVLYISPPIYSGGVRAPDHVQIIAEVIGQTCSYWSFTGMNNGKWYPLLVISPSIAKVIASDGWTKDDVRKYLYENVKIPASLVEKYARNIGNTTFSLFTQVEKGVIPKDYCQSTDPNRLVRVFLKPEWMGIVVAGDPGRNQSRGYVNNHRMGGRVSRKIKLPKDWEQLFKRG